MAKAKANSAKKPSASPSKTAPAIQPEFPNRHGAVDGNPDERARPGMVPVMMVRTTHTVIVQLSRVPCVGEIVHMWEAQGGRNFRVTCVQHLPPVFGHWWEVVAEIHCIEVEDLDPWDGQHPSQQQ